MQRDGGPGGAGGAGNPTGGSFTGPAQTLDIYGDFAVAYSGSVGVGAAETTLLSFQTGNFLFVGTVNFSKNNSDGDDMQYQVYINDIAIIGLVEEYSTTRDVFFTPVPIIIPSYSVVKATALDLTGDNDRPIFSAMTGRIYRG